MCSPSKRSTLVPALVMVRMRRSTCQLNGTMNSPVAKLVYPDGSAWSLPIEPGNNCRSAGESTCHPSLTHDEATPALDRRGPVATQPGRVARGSLCTITWLVRPVRSRWSAASAALSALRRAASRSRTTRAATSFSLRVLGKAGTSSSGSAWSWSRSRAMVLAPLAAPSVSKAAPSGVTVFSSPLVSRRPHISAYFTRQCSGVRRWLPFTARTCAETPSHSRMAGRLVATATAPPKSWTTRPRRVAISTAVHRLTPPLPPPLRPRPPPALAPSLAPAPAPAPAPLSMSMPLAPPLSLVLATAIAPARRTAVEKRVALVAVAEREVAAAADNGGEPPAT